MDLFHRLDGERRYIALTLEYSVHVRGSTWYQSLTRAEPTVSTEGESKGNLAMCYSTNRDWTQLQCGYLERVGFLPCTSALRLIQYWLASLGYWSKHNYRKCLPKAECFRGGYSPWFRIRRGSACKQPYVLLCVVDVPESFRRCCRTRPSLCCAG